MNSRRSQRGGRKNNNERIRELVALLGSLSRTGDTVSIDAISTRLGIGEDEARTMMDIVCQASGEEMGGLLISSDDEETEYTLQFPGVAGRPIRLTPAETIALAHALDTAGIDEGDSLRERLRVAFLSADVAVEEVRRALGQGRGVSARLRESLVLCARSQVESRVLTFRYQGLRDAQPRPRAAVVRRLSMQGDVWYAVALDTALNQERTFRVDRMAKITLGDVAKREETASPTEVQEVQITFLDKAYYYAFSWPELRITHEDKSVLRGYITYYGERSTWLIRRICAGNGCITVNDERIMQLARKYARSLLEQWGKGDTHHPA